MRFRDHRDAGDILELASRYCADGADELVFYDITASPDGRSVDRSWVSRVAALLDIPFCVAGGIRDIRSAEEVLHKGADKVSVNTPALENPGLINELAERFGSQCVVVGIDSHAAGDDYLVYRNTGDPDKTRSDGRRTVDWVREAQDRGAGEFVLNCMNRDGVMQGYDCAQVGAVRSICTVPLVASGGAGTMDHFREVFETAGADAALAASVFHSSAIRIAELKRYLLDAGLDIRPVDTTGAS